MKKILITQMEKFQKYRMKLPIFVLWVYLWILFSLQSISVDAEMSVVFWMFLGLLSFTTAFLILQFLPDKMLQIKMNGNNQHSYRVGLIVAVVTFLFFEMYLAGQYPGGMSPDTITQYSQGIGEATYNDWHPVLHTLLFFTLPLKTGYRLGFVVFMQLIYFSLVLGYLAYVLHKNKCPKLFLSMICVYIWINPFMATYMMYPWKDIGLTIFAILLMGYYIQIICTKGKWLDKIRNLVLFSVVTVICGFMRHNAVLFVAPIVLIVLMYALKSRKARIGVVLGIAFCFLLVKILYDELGVEQPDRRTMETVGLPLTVWCNVMQKNPDALPEETQKFMYALATQEAYESEYVVGSFNNIKWSGTIDNEKIDALTYGDVLRYTCQCFRYAPKASFEALAKLTDMVWAVDGKDAPITPTVADNSWEIVKKSYPKSELFVNQEKAFFSSGFGKILFGSIGFELLIMVIFAVSMFAKKRFAFIHMLPLFCYDFGTMLLLSGSDYRFFLLNIPLWLAVLFLMLFDETKMPFSIRTKKKDKKLPVYFK